MQQACVRRVGGVGLVGALVLCGAGMAGCVYDPPVKGQREKGDAVQGGGKVAVESPFAPVSLRVHPLTHIDAARAAAGDASGCLLVLHLETKDAYGDAVKGVGSLRVELAGGGGGGESVAWDVSEMLDPAANSARFDVATRTYRLPLKAPAWVAAWAREGSGKLTLRAMFSVADGEGSRRVMRDEFVIEK